MTQKTPATNKRFYETVCLTKVDMPEDKFNTLLDRCKKAVTENGKGEWLYNDDWGKAKIAYAIEKEPRAQWTYFRFQSEPAGVDELVRSLGINEFVLRQMTTRTLESGADYNTLRPSFPKDLNERDKPREWKDPRRSRGPRGEGRDDNRRDFRDNRGGDRDNRDAPRSDRPVDAAPVAAAAAGTPDKKSDGV